MTNETIMKKIAEMKKKAARSREDAELKKKRLAEDLAIKQRRIDEDEEIKQRRIAEDIAELESALDDVPEEPVAEENVQVVTKKGINKKSMDKILAKAREYRVRKHEELAQEFYKLQKVAYSEDQWVDIDVVRDCTTEELRGYVATARQAVAEIEKAEHLAKLERRHSKVIAQAQRCTAVEKCKKAIAA